MITRLQTSAGYNDQGVGTARHRLVPSYSPATSRKRDKAFRVFIEQVSMKDAVGRRRAPFLEDVTVFASWQAHYQAHQSTDSSSLCIIDAPVFAEANGRKRR